MGVPWSSSLPMADGGAQQAHHVVVVCRRGPAAPGDPVEQVGVGAVEQGFESVQLGAVQVIKRRLGERAEQKVDLLRAAVPAAEQKPPTADLGMLVPEIVGT